MNVSQIFLSDSDTELSPFLKHATQTVQQAFPGDYYQLYNKKSLRCFIEENYEEEVLWAYDCLRPYAYKADLGRFCLLNKLGGWYFDCALTCLTGVELASRIGLLAFRSMHKFAMNGWACDNGIIFAQSNHPVLSAAISNLLDNVKNKYYGITPLCPTGPSLWGKSIAAASQESIGGIVFGDCIELTPLHARKNKSFVLPDGTILAACKPAEGGDLKILGATGTNNYNDLWHARKIYI